ncbi:MAG: hypothetical protein M3014_04525 [Chloroflexota bacterium]|nr:hypothetical protein [Chloroflexota bacterium]
MDNKDQNFNNADGSANSGVSAAASGERSSEEVEWDKEFGGTGPGPADDVAATVADLTRLAVSIPFALVRMSGMMLPRETRHHARAAVRESFLAARSLLGALGDGIENLLSDPLEKEPTHSGPEGTWGTGRAAGGATSRTRDTKIKHISLIDEEDNSVEQPGGHDTGSASGPLSEEMTESRGLRADIDY